MRATIRLKLIVALVVGLVLIAGATSILMHFVHERAIAAAARHEVQTAASVLENIEALERERMSALLEVMVANERLAERLEGRDRAGLLALAQPVFEALRAEHGITHWYFHPPEPRRDGVLLRVHRPDLHSDAVRRRTVARAAAELRETSGCELGRTGFALRVVRPWLREGRLLGFVELGEDVHSFLARVKATTGAELGMLLAKERIDRNAWGAVARDADRWDARPELLAVETTTGDEDVLGGLGRLADVPDEPAVLEQLRRRGRVEVRGVFPLRADDGAKVGGVVVVHDVTALHGGAREVRGRVVVLVGLLAAALGALLVFLLETLVFERLARMERVLEDLPARLERGDYELAGPGPARDDEVGRFERFLEKALRQVGSFVADVRRDRDARRGPRSPDP